MGTLSGYIDNKLLELIPQRPPMVMIGELVYVDEIKAISTLRVSSDNLFVESGQMTEEGMLENVAQTCAAMAGYANRSEGRPIQKGFIAGVKEVRVVRRAAVGSDIKTTVELAMEVLSMRIFKGKVEDVNGTCVDCEMRIFLEQNGENGPEK